MKYRTAFCLIIILLTINCKRNSTNPTEISYITLDEIYQQKIFNFVDSLINLKSKVWWTNLPKIVIWKTSDSLFATRLRLKFENGDSYIQDKRFKGQHRGDMNVISDYISKRWDGFVQKYYFKDDSLSNGRKTYIFKGRIKFRSTLHITDDLLKDSVFIKQCNNVVYWAQTFNFQVEDILSETD